MIIATPDYRIPIPNAVTRAGDAADGSQPGPRAAGMDEFAGQKWSAEWEHRG